MCIAIRGRTNNCKDWRLKKLTKVFSRFVIKKTFFYSFTCIFPDHMFMKSPQNFEKNSNFENITAGFLQRCQTLLWYFTTKMMHFRHEKKNSHQ